MRFTNRLIFQRKNDDLKKKLIAGWSVKWWCGGVCGGWGGGSVSVGERLCSKGTAYII